MAKVSNYKLYGAAIITRLKGAPARLKVSLDAFKAAHTQYADAHDATEAAELAWRESLQQIEVADDAQDLTVDQLADALVAAGLGTRIKPYAKFTKYSPTELKKLAVATETKTLTEIAAAILKAAPPAAVKTAVQKLAQLAGKTQAAIDASSEASGAYSAALATRNELVPEWTVTLNRLKKETAAAWADEPARVKAAFAPVARIAAPVKKRKPSKMSEAPVKPPAQ